MSVKKLNKSVDERGVFEELVKHPEYGQISIFTINPGKTRGNHYHKRTKEIFTVIEGKCVCIYKYIKTGVQMQFPMKSGDSIEFLPMVKHSFFNQSNFVCKVLVWRPDMFNLNDQDTFYE